MPTIVISWSYEFRHAAWSAAVCPWCEQLEAMRVEDVIEVFSIYFIPVSRSPAGGTIRCDFCERRMELDTLSPQVSVERWSQKEGLPALLRLLAPDEQVDLPAPNADARLLSLLKATRKTASVDSIDVSFGLTTGLLLGPLVGIPLGLLFHHLGWLGQRIDELGAAMIGAFLSLAACTILGGTIQALVMRPRIAREKIRAAHEKYQIDLNKLGELARSVGGVVRRAVARVAFEIACKG